MKWILKATLPCLLAFALRLQAADDYVLGPDSMRQEGVPAGRVEGPFMFKSEIYTNTIRDYYIYVPAQYDQAKPAAEHQSNWIFLREGSGHLRFA